eukprot:scaffold150316_cov19-Tisochrysis_lutea.AAC.2
MMWVQAQEGAVDAKQLEEFPAYAEEAERHEQSQAATRVKVAVNDSVSNRPVFPAYGMNAGASRC